MVGDIVEGVKDVVGKGEVGGRRRAVRNRGERHPCCLGRPAAGNRILQRQTTFRGDLHPFGRQQIDVGSGLSALHFVASGDCPTTIGQGKPGYHVFCILARAGGGYAPGDLLPGKLVLQSFQAGHEGYALALPHRFPETRLAGGQLFRGDGELKAFLDNVRALAGTPADHLPVCLVVHLATKIGENGVPHLARQRLRIDHEAVHVKDDGRELC